MSSQHPGGLDPDVLVGDGGEGWFAAQRRNQRNQQQSNRHKHNKHYDEELDNKLKNEKAKLLSKQEKKRLKRQKKKKRQQQFKQNNNDHNNNQNYSSTSNSRSSFLYGNQNNKDPRTKTIEHRNNHNDNNHSHHPVPYKNYVKSSNQEELNIISAKMMKAKLSSNMKLYNELEKKLDDLRSKSIIIEHRYESSKKQTDYKKDREIDNSLMDENGKRIDLIMNAKIAKKLHETEDMNDINDNDDINTLLKKERNRNSLGFNKNMKKILALDNTDDQFDSIDTEQILTNSRKRKRRNEEKEKNVRNYKRARLISQHKNERSWLDSCIYCRENEPPNDNFSFNVIYYGKFMYIAVPKYECLVDYQCCIIPNMHITNYRQGIFQSSKEEQYEFEKELHFIQKILCKLFKTKCDSGVIFMETVRNLNKNKQYHAIINVYPLKLNEFNMSPVFFQKAINDSDKMWITNDMKKCIKITKNKPLNKSIPPNMAYFYVQFGLYDGYVHVIEDETKVKQDFGPQIIAGILNKVLFKIRNENYRKQIERANNLKILFEPFKDKLDSKLNKQPIFE